MFVCNVGLWIYSEAGGDLGEASYIRPCGQSPCQVPLCLCTESVRPRVCHTWFVCTRTHSHPHTQMHTQTHTQIHTQTYACAKHVCLCSGSERHRCSAWKVFYCLLFNMLPLLSLVLLHATTQHWCLASWVKVPSCHTWVKVKIL
jgi:hypothetical protein